MYLQITKFEVSGQRYEAIWGPAFLGGDRRYQEPVCRLLIFDMVRIRIVRQLENGKIRLLMNCKAELNEST